MNINAQELNRRIEAKVQKKVGQLGLDSVGPEARALYLKERLGSLIAIVALAASSETLEYITERLQ